MGLTACKTDFFSNWSLVKVKREEETRRWRGGGGSGGCGVCGGGAVAGRGGSALVEREIKEATASLIFSST